MPFLIDERPIVDLLNEIDDFCAFCDQHDRDFVPPPEIDLDRIGVLLDILDKSNVGYRRGVPTVALDWSCPRIRLMTEPIINELRPMLVVIRSIRTGGQFGPAGWD